MRSSFMKMVLEKPANLIVILLWEEKMNSSFESFKIFSWDFRSWSWEKALSGFEKLNKLTNF